MLAGGRGDRPASNLPLFVSFLLFFKKKGFILLKHTLL
jgi:hypothetical protein